MDGILINGATSPALTPPFKPKRQRRKASGSQVEPTATSSLKAPLEAYRKVLEECNVALRGAYDKGMTDEESAAHQQKALEPLDAARAAMIEAPVASVSDIATKLNFLLQLDADGFDGQEWSIQIAKAILRDIPGLSTVTSVAAPVVAPIADEVQADEPPPEDAADYANEVMTESFRIGHAIELLELVADCVGTPGQVKLLTDLELQQVGLTLEYLVDQMRGHNCALQSALSKLEG